MRYPVANEVDSSETRVRGPSALPTTMRAVVLRRFGPPDVLQVEEVPVPRPARGEVLIQVHAVSVNRTLDVHVRRDGNERGVQPPLILGVDPPA